MLEGSRMNRLQYASYLLNHSYCNPSLDTSQSTFLYDKALLENTLYMGFKNLNNLKTWH